MRAPAITPAERRLGVAYAAVFLALGASLPFLPRWLEAKGLSGEEVGLALGLGMIARFVASIAAGVIADRTGRPRRVMATAGALTTVGYVLMVTTDAPVALMALTVFVTLVKAPVTPILESLAVAASRAGWARYAPVRAVGSAAFIVANIALGAAMAAFGVDVLMIWLIIGGGFVVWASLTAPKGPDVSVRGQGRARGASAWSALLTPASVLAFAASALTQGSHAFFYGFSVLVWRDAGLSDAVIGLLWAWGVAAEIVFLMVIGRIAPRIGPGGLAALGAAAGVVRWTWLAQDPGLIGAALAQTLHAGTFAAAHLGFIRHAEAHIPPEATATAQSVNSALMLGGVLAGATAVSGILYERIGAGGYWAMTVLAVAGLLAALAYMRVAARRSA